MFGGVCRYGPTRCKAIGGVSKLLRFNKIDGYFTVDKVGCETGRGGVSLRLVKEPRAHKVFAGSEDTTETTEENSGNWPNPLMCASAATSCCWFFWGNVGNPAADWWSALR